MINNDVEKRESIRALLKCKCPRCRKGDMFEAKNAYDLNNFMKMNTECAVCNQPFDMEPGFYYGTSYVSYAFAIAITVATFIAWWIIVGISVDDNRVFYWLIVNAVILLLSQPYLMRLARTVWLAFFVKYDPEWSRHAPKKPYSVNKEQMNAW